MSSASGLKVLMVNTPQSVKFKGGDTTQIVKTAEALRKMGAEVGESVEAEPDATGYDVAHVFNLRTIAVTPQQVASLRRYGVPVVMSPIYLDPGRALWANRVVRNIFGATRSEEDLNKLIDEFRSYRLRITTPEGQVLFAEGSNRPIPNYDQTQLDVLRDISYLLPNSMLEMAALAKTLRVVMPFTIVPYAADSTTFLDPDPEPFVRQFGQRDFVLQVGRIETSKNQLMMVYAMRNAGLPVVLIGTNLQPEYLAWCKQYGPRDLRHIPHLPVDQLRHAYAAARVHVLPSWIETCGLVSMEAALANCNLVGSIAGFELEYYRDFIYYCDPSDPDSICNAVLQAYHNYDREAPRRAALKQFILTNYTWEKAAEACLEGYRRVLQK
jgi:glycosyltransferase involved in cell wall biosynthesis